MILRVREGMDYAVEWPLSYDELAPWYSHVEQFAGISGNFDGLDTLPDGDFLPAWEMNCVESDISRKINAHYKDRHVVQGRCAHLTKPQRNSFATGKKSLSGEQRMRKRLSLRRIFQFQFLHDSLGSKNRKSHDKTRQCCAFHHL